MALMQNEQVRDRLTQRMKEITFQVYLTTVTDHSSSVPPPCRRWITRTDHLLHTEFQCVLSSL